MKIICPNCKNEFQINESDYLSIVKQIRDAEFKKELDKRETSLINEKEQAVKLAEIEVTNKFKEQILEKEKSITKLEEELKSKETEKELAINKAIQEKDKEIIERDNIINVLKNAKEQEEKDNKIKQQELEKNYEQKLKDKDEQIERYKDLKLKLSTKMLGETLEQHCEIQFNQIRATAFKNAYFEKDNDSSSGSKGDYIFKEYDEGGNEILSIMFEMKNESDVTATKHKNEDFFRELDKDRNEKNCEYAILVSLLEQDNELYNNGIVDISYKYPKMYVIRPQFFIPIITILRNAAMNSLQYKQELMIVKNQNIDVSNFEKELNMFKNDFTRNCRLAGDHFQSAIKDIDNTIKNLQKTKEELLLTIKNLTIANDKLDDVSVKRLTRNNPTMAQKFAETKNN